MAERKTFVEHDRKYFVFQDESEKACANNCSCIIIEDEPGAYRKFAKNLVESGVCRLAAVLPFSEQSLRLLNGAEGVFGSDVTFQIPTLTRCVAILDMRNESPSTFEGEEDKAMAGVHFQRRLNKRVVSFFATGYGSARFKETGLNGIYGFVDVTRKSGVTSADLSEKDHATLLSAVELGLNDLCFRTQNIITVRDKLIVFSFRGWEMPFVLDTNMKLLVEILRPGGQKIHNNELLGLIGCKGYPIALDIHKEAKDRNCTEGQVGNEDLADDGSLSARSGRKVGKIHTLDDLRGYQEMVKKYHHRIERMQELEHLLSQAVAEYKSFNETYKMVKASQKKGGAEAIHLDVFESYLFDHFVNEGHEQDAAQRLAELVIKAIGYKDEYESLRKSEYSDVNASDLKNYMNWLYKWKLAGRPSSGLIEYEDPSYTGTARRYLSRALTMIKKSSAPEEFYRHLRDSIRMDWSHSCYVGGEEWTFK